MLQVNAEQQRLLDKAWKVWGPYLTERQWGTVREDYSANGDAWHYTTHSMARSKAYRWGEEGIAGWSDSRQLLCLSMAFWNTNDPILKERFFGVTGTEGNHGEDVKELYYYLDATPTHSYMKMLYKYPQATFPYENLVAENSRRSKLEPEYELMDTGIFDKDAYFDIFVEYAKSTPNDILLKITIYNRGEEPAPLHVLPTLWFRNKWDFGLDDQVPHILGGNADQMVIEDADLGQYFLYADGEAKMLFCNNETNVPKLYGAAENAFFYKDGINDYVVNNDLNAANTSGGTKAAFHYQNMVHKGQPLVVRLRLSSENNHTPFVDFDAIFEQRLMEADDFYADIQKALTDTDEKLVQRQAFAGMLWSKQFYYYDVSQWLQGDTKEPAPPEERKEGRNKAWQHLNNADIISMPDKWEYPWYASWDLAFHCLPLSMVDPEFAKKQLKLLTKVWYLHPNGQMPAYEWNFSDVNPPVHAWSTFRVFKIDEAHNNKPDIEFLESVFHKLLLNFTWWVNRKDVGGNNIFEGGFLGLDNIGVFDRSAPLPTGGYTEQADGTSWMAMYCLNLMRISLELARYNNVYEEMATKFFEHFLYIAKAMESIGNHSTGLWDETDGFFYDVLHLPGGGSIPLKVRSIVGLIPLFAVEVLDHELLTSMPEFTKRLKWLYANKPDLVKLVSRWDVKGSSEMHLLSLLRGHRMKRMIARMLDESEFLSTHGIRSVSKWHEEHPYEIFVDGTKFSVGYLPAESDSNMFGGNSNWRGPVWMPLNFLIIESLQRFHFYYGDDFKIAYPSGSDNMLTLNQVAAALSQRLCGLFLLDENGNRPVHGSVEKLQRDPYFKDLILFYEYFDGNTGRGVGASHQTGWTGLVAKLLQPRG